MPIEVVLKGERRQEMGTGCRENGAEIVGAPSVR